MKYSAFICLLFSTLFFFNCSKKDLPAPNPLNANNTPIYPQGTNINQTLTAPCVDSLKPNTISYTFSPSGTVMYFAPQVNEYMGVLNITCSDYSTYNEIQITLPYRNAFVGKLKYSVGLNGSTQLSHSFNSGFYYAFYDGYKGDIYAEYTRTQIILSFCDVKVKDSSGSMHDVKGQVVVANTF